MIISASACQNSLRRLAIIRALVFRTGCWSAHRVWVSIPVVLRVVDGLLDLRGWHRAAEHTFLLSIPGFTRYTQLVPRSRCHGDGSALPSALPSVWTLLAAVVVADRALFVLEERLAATFVTLAAVAICGAEQRCFAAVCRAHSARARLDSAFRTTASPFACTPPCDFPGHSVREARSTGSRHGAEPCCAASSPSHGASQIR